MTKSDPRSSLHLLALLPSLQDGSYPPRQRAIVRGPQQGGNSEPAGFHGPHTHAYYTPTVGTHVHHTLIHMYARAHPDTHPRSPHMHAHPPGKPTGARLHAHTGPYTGHLPLPADVPTKCVRTHTHTCAHFSFAQGTSGGPAQPRPPQARVRGEALPIPNRGP